MSFSKYNIHALVQLVILVLYFHVSILTHDSLLLELDIQEFLQCYRVNFPHPQNSQNGGPGTLAQKMAFGRRSYGITGDGICPLPCQEVGGKLFWYRNRWTG